jgi:hypothetical protein
MSGTITIYECQECGAEDQDNGWNPPAPLDLNCWKCKGTRGCMIPARKIEREMPVVG